MIYFLLPFFVFIFSCSTVSNPVVSGKPEFENLSSDTLKIYDIFYVTGKFDPAGHPEFMLIPEVYADQNGRYIRKDVFEAYKKMYAAAKKEGIHLVIISATRNFEAQKKIWEDKWFGRRLLEGGINALTDISDDSARARKILEYSSMPGTSRHHWGTDIDLNALQNDYFAKGEGKKIYQWLEINAADFGFCQTYTSFGIGRKSGYQEEKWHWSFTPVSRPLTEWAEKHFKDSMISGFAGSHTAISLNIVEKYVLGINQQCLQN
ncbi:MAG: M15 family metallopeptidase [Saprospiraceae bacterium]|nr:M15 family metallopeptidase [Saprospiraceae bacterium]